MEDIFVGRCVRFFVAFAGSPEIWDAVSCVETESVPGARAEILVSERAFTVGRRYECHLSYFQETLAASEKTGGKPH